MRSGTGSGTAGLVWILGDHLGSTAFTVNAATGLKQSERRYKPWGEVRYSEGETGTKYAFTGQMAEVDKLYYFGARFYDSYIGRWTQPDSLVPNLYNPLDWDRYQYVRSNSLNLIDPVGHKPCDQDDENCEEGYGSEFYRWFQEEKDKLYRYEAWERTLIVLAIYSESSNGTYPPTLLYFLGLVYANKIEMGLADLITAALDSGILSQDPDPDHQDLVDLFPALADLAKMSEKQISDLMSRIDQAMTDANLGWKAAKTAADLGLSNAVDPSNGATGFRAATDEKAWARTMETAMWHTHRLNVWSPYYRYTTFGPFHNDTMNRDVWMIFDNWDYCNRMTGAG